jgi:hypothetical protein
VNTDIRIAVTFKGHRKRKKLAKLIGDRATDYLIDLWLTVAQERPTGVLTQWDAEDVAMAAGWKKNPEIFVEALLKSRFLDQGADGIFLVHGWEEHQPYVVHANVRSARAKKAAEVRWGCPTHAGSMPKAKTEHAERYAPYPTPSPNPNPSPSPARRMDGDVSHPDGATPGAPGKKDPALYSPEGIRYGTPIRR